MEAWLYPVHVLFDVATVLIVVHAVAAGAASLFDSPEAARLRITRGLGDGLLVTTAGSLVKSIHLASWHSIGLFLATFALTLAIKWELRRSTDSLRAA